MVVGLGDGASVVVGMVAVLVMTVFVEGAGFVTVVLGWWWWWWASVVITPLVIDWKKLAKLVRRWWPLGLRSTAVLITIIGTMAL